MNRKFAILRAVPGTGDIFSETGRSAAKGLFVGDYADDVNFVDHSFTINNGRFAALPDFPDATVTSAIDTNDAGTQILALYTLDPEQSTGFRGAIFSNGRWSLTFAYPGATVTSTFALGMNNGGWIVGSFQTASGEEHGFIRRPAGAFLQLDYPGAVETEAFAINNGGDIVGRYLNGNGQNHGFVLADGKFTTLDYPGSSFTYAFGINEQGDIAGWYQTAPGPNFHGFVAGRK